MRQTEAKQKREPKPKKQTLVRKTFFSTTKIDLMTVITVLLLLVFGIIMIYSASYYYAKVNHEPETRYFLVQLIAGALGFVFMLLMSRIRPRHYMIIWWLSAILVLLFIFSVKIPTVGVTLNGASRWIKIAGLTLQVAEPVKLFLIIFVAGFIASFGIAKIRRQLILFLAVGLLCGLLAVITNNASAAIIIILTTYLTVAISSKYPKRYLLVLAGVLLLAFLILVIYLKAKPYDPEENFRITRFRAWLDASNPLYFNKAGYQPRQARFAIASGGFFGKGLGQSLLKFTLPEPINDYILAIVFEELGIFGVLILTALYVYLLYRIFLIYRDTKKNDWFSKCLVLGVFFHLSLQVVLNYAMTLGLLPTVGVTLSFLSYGGTSILFTEAEIGLVLAVARQNAENKLYDEARDDEKKADETYRDYMNEKELSRKGKKAKEQTDGE